MPVFTARLTVGSVRPVSELARWAVSRPATPPAPSTRKPATWSMDSAPVVPSPKPSVPPTISNRIVGTPSTLVRVRPNVAAVSVTPATWTPMTVPDTVR